MQDRRSFFKTLATAVAGFSILPPATTYARVWRASRPALQTNPDWVTATHEMIWVGLPAYQIKGVGPLVYKRVTTQVVDIERDAIPFEKVGDRFVFDLSTPEPMRRFADMCMNHAK